jgi:hypothetical protein
MYIILGEFRIQHSGMQLDDSRLLTNKIQINQRTMKIKGRAEADKKPITEEPENGERSARRSGKSAKKT